MSKLHKNSIIRPWKVGPLLITSPYYFLLLFFIIFSLLFIIVHIIFIIFHLFIIFSLIFGALGPPAIGKKFGPPLSSNSVDSPAAARIFLNGALGPPGTRAWGDPSAQDFFFLRFFFGGAHAPAPIKKNKKT